MASPPPPPTPQRCRGVFLRFGAEAITIIDYCGGCLEAKGPADVGARRGTDRGSAGPRAPMGGARTKLACACGGRCHAPTALRPGLFFFNATTVAKRVGVGGRRARPSPSTGRDGRDPRACGHAAGSTRIANVGAVRESCSGGRILCAGWACDFNTRCASSIFRYGEVACAHARGTRDLYSPRAQNPDRADPPRIATGPISTRLKSTQSGVQVN